MKKKNRLQYEIGKLTALVLTAGLVFSPIMSMRVSALQDGTSPADSQETAAADGLQQGMPLGIQQDSLQEMQQNNAEELSQESESDSTQDATQDAAQVTVDEALGYTAEDIAGYGAKVLAGSKGLYSIRINRDACTVTVYQTLVTGEQVPFKAFICSASQWTPTGQFSIQNKIGWSALAGGVYGQYCMPITGPYWFHSVPYYSMNADDLEYEEFNKLGQNVSLGCVRLMVQDVKWIFDNCDVGTPVEIYDDVTNPGPLGQPEAIRIDLNNKKRGWDPTDPDPDNPWTWMEVLEYNRDEKYPVQRENGLLKNVMCGKSD